MGTFAQVDEDVVWKRIRSVGVCTTDSCEYGNYSSYHLKAENSMTTASTINFSNKYPCNIKPSRKQFSYRYTNVKVMYIKPLALSLQFLSSVLLYFSIQTCGHSVHTKACIAHIRQQQAPWPGGQQRGI
jgi:hypothetical protein